MFSPVIYLRLRYTKCHTFMFWQFSRYRAYKSVANFFDQKNTAVKVNFLQKEKTKIIHTIIFLDFKTTSSDVFGQIISWSSIGSNGLHFEYKWTCFMKDRPGFVRFDELGFVMIAFLSSTEAPFGSFRSCCVWDNVELSATLVIIVQVSMDVSENWNKWFF